MTGGRRTLVAVLLAALAGAAVYAGLKPDTVAGIGQLAADIARLLGS